MSRWYKWQGRNAARCEGNASATPILRQYSQCNFVLAGLNHLRRDPLLHGSEVLVLSFVVQLVGLVVRVRQWVSWRGRSPRRSP